MNVTRTMTVELVGQGRVKLSPTDHLATGGEGKVFRLGNFVIKLYHNPSKMIHEGSADKLSLLAGLQHPFLIAPRGLVLDDHGIPLGWYMDYIDGEPLARAFTNDWRGRHQFDHKEASIVADGMREVMQYAHNQNAVMADANEMNWLVVMRPQTKPEPRALDIDSWAIGRWPARVIMPSIRDWHTQGLTRASDWFAWGVTTFQLFTGVHPYKGSLSGYRAGDLEKRMRDNASVFSPGVRLNRAVRDFSCIPGALLDWYEATFQAGLRQSPPSPMQLPTAKRRQPPSSVTVTAMTALDYQVLYGNGDAAKRIFACGAVLLESGKLIDLNSQRIITSNPQPNIEVIAVDQGWLVASVDKGLICAQYIGRNLMAVNVTPTVAAKLLVRSGNRLFAVTEQGLTELSLLKFTQPRLVARQTWSALQSTQWFDGIGIQDTFGTAHIILPFGNNACMQIRAPELDSLRVVMARGGTRLAAVITIDANGQYRRHEFSFDREYRQYALVSQDVDTPELNLAILPRGVCASIYQDGQLSIYVPANGSTRQIVDRDATTALQLSNWGESLLAIRDGSVLRLTLK
jgi:hypothetical protein